MEKLLTVIVTAFASVFVAAAFGKMWDNIPWFRHAVMSVWGPVAPMVMPQVTRAMNVSNRPMLIGIAVCIAIVAGLVRFGIQPRLTVKGSVPK